NLVLETKARDIPLLLINGRMSTASYRAWRRRPGLSRPLFSAFDLVLAQNDGLAERFAQLGATRSLDVGNLKVDAPAPPTDLPGRRELAKAIGKRPVLLAASTHQGEDEIVAEAHTILKRKLPDLLTIIVPRHPERGPPIAEQLRNANLACELRSDGKLPDSGTDIYIADTIGEIGLFYRLAAVAFIGGSLVSKGGQNPVEAIKLGAAVLTGPHWKNFSDSYDALLRAGGAKEVTDAESLAAAALVLLQDILAREVMRASADRVIAGMSGALPRTLAELEPYLPKAALQHAS
ncbi:MAG: 3-deoxy-D-manno-octulosonic acid transferase, partial [Methyloceanibacter sp.]